MSLWSLLPHRCLGCGQGGPDLLCRACQARWQPRGTVDAGWCRLCGHPLLGEDHLCMDCQGQAWSFASLTGLFSYQDPGAELVRWYKLDSLPSLGAPWARTLPLFLQPPGPLVPVPPLRSHLWDRGWDPVASLARRLSRATGLPVWRVLARRPSASQKNLQSRDRLANAQRAYQLRVPGRRLPNTPVWLVDDIVTTGATAEACAQRLLEAGVQSVRVLCISLH